MKPLTTRTALNGVCPYFTMFPLAFPLRILATRAQPSEWVLDPFSGRGTTTYAARLLGLPSIGIDSSRVAVALTQAKLASAGPGDIERCAARILETSAPAPVPRGEFWRWAYDPSVLQALATLRAALVSDCRSDTRKALLAILLGALHGPVRVGEKSYFSNQSPRTYAPKPAYAVRFWKERALRPPPVDVLSLVRTRAERFFRDQPKAVGAAIRGDSRRPEAFAAATSTNPRWIITSPPYYGMRTYVPDQWLRNWFLGGPAEVDYSADGQLSHRAPDEFAADLRRVWRNLAAVAAADATMVVRFGGISDRKAEPLAILKSSLDDSGWRVQTIVPARSAAAGKRQSLSFNMPRRKARLEHDLWARLA